MASYLAQLGKEHRTREMSLTNMADYPVWFYLHTSTPLKEEAKLLCEAGIGN